MIRFTFAARLAAAGAMLVLAGCASKEPLDYLPEGQAYMAVNMAEVRNDAGTKRLMNVLQKLDQSAVRADNAAERMYFALAGTPPQLSVYGVMIGREGFADQALADLKAAGASEGKLAGRKAVVGEKFSLSPISKRAVLFFSRETDLEKMIDTSKRKSPGAAQTALFRRTQRLSNEHGLLLTLNAGPLIAMAGPRLGMLSMLNAKGADALKQAEALELTLDWDEKPAVRAALTCPQEGREDLATLLNMLLGQVKQSMQAMQTAMQAQGQTAMLTLAGGALLQKLEVKAGQEGVELTLEFPKEDSDALLARMEAMAENLPKDPAERAKALREAFVQAGR